MRIMVNRMKEPKSLKRSLMVFIILCWGVPVITFFIFTTVSYQNGVIKKSEAVMEDQLVNVAAYASMRIEEAIALCQKPSYEKEWEYAWKSSQTGISNEAEYLDEIKKSLILKFQSDERFRDYAYYHSYYQDGNMHPDIFSFRYRTSQDYMGSINQSVLGIIEEGTNYTKVKIMNGNIFIIRNLYTTTLRYQYYGTIVVELNANWVFRDISDDLKSKLGICIDDTESYLTFSDFVDGEKPELIRLLLELYDSSENDRVDMIKERPYQGYMYQKRYNNYHMGLILLADSREIYSSLYDFYNIVALMLVVFIPLTIYCIYFLRKQIQDPVGCLVSTAKEMENGNIGAKVEAGAMPNEEFNYLVSSFNSMSVQVKYLFDTVYNEKLARKDAQIAALQAQIDPHFLNNTLEMMNWQARMNQDVVISKMIESLGTVLDYRMNRTNIREIPLWEELRCADAYFYIMSMRYGQRLQIEKKVDESLKQIKVPPLILQPLVENAIVHGVERVKNGIIQVHIYHDDVNVYVKVRNSGKKLTEGDLERIRVILDKGEEQIPMDQKKHTSIGIRNVNLRIKLVYGEEYGLSICPEGEDITVSTIVLPFVPSNDSKAQDEEAEWRKFHTELKKLKNKKQEDENV